MGLGVQAGGSVGKNWSDQTVTDALYGNFSSLGKALQVEAVSRNIDIKDQPRWIAERYAQASAEVQAYYTQDATKDSVSVTSAWEAVKEGVSKAAEQGYAKSQYNLAWMYDEGRGVEQDYQQAIQWYQKGAELGNKMAQHHLADLYLKGYEAKVLEQCSTAARQRLVRKDEDKARYWFKKSAQQGYAQSQYKLARLYLDENGRFGRDAEAVQLLKKAGKQGIPEAYTLVGMAYISGRGVAESRVKAAYYLLKAFKDRHLDAGKFLLPCILPVSIK